MKHLLPRLGLAILLSLSLATAMWGSTEKVLYSFAGGPDGILPTSNLIADKAGNLYGTASEGGTSNTCGPFGVQSCGVVFELSPSGGGWTEKAIYTFTGGTDGGTPYGGLVIDANGNLYGTTNTGGTNNLGTVFELMPGGNGAWTEVVLHSFAGGSDGELPRAGLIMKGNSLAGTTTLGGTGTGCLFGTSCGTVFGLTHTNSGWVEQVLYTFLGGSDGGVPYGGLALDAAGNLYGTTTQYGPLGFGTVFQLTRKNGAWTENILYSFAGGSDGSFSESTPLLDPVGNLYGTTSARGTSNLGTVFQLQKGQSAWTFNGLHSFSGNGDGGTPDAGLARRGASVFGTTYYGGTNYQCGIFGSSPCGTVYELSQSQQGITYSVVYSFFGSPDANQPLGSLLIDSNGNLYGTGSSGGASGQGAVFEITP